MATRPFRFGAVCEHAQTAQEFGETARRIEGSGFSTLLMPDHFDDRFAPLPALAAVAAATTTLRLGTYVADNDYRHPVVLAKEVATVDVLSGGRFELGIGAGWERRDYDWSGIAFDPPARRVERLREAITVLKGLFAEGPCTHSGRHYRITALQGTPKPTQRPHPPILIGAGGPKMLELAAEEADIVSVNFRLDAGVFEASTAATGTSAATDVKIEALRRSAGPRFAHLELGVTVFFAQITEDRDAVARTIAPAMGMSTDSFLASPHVLVGSMGQLTDELERRRERFGFSYVAFALDTYRAMAPLVSCLAGA